MHKRTSRALQAILTFAALVIPSLAQAQVVAYGQRWQPWANYTCGWGPGTIAQYGCAITALASMETWRGWGHNPGTLNAWGRSHGGFSGNLVVWGAYPGYRALRDYSYVTADLAWINHQLDIGNVVIVKTYMPPFRQQAHWVLLYGRTGNTYRMMDPWTGSVGQTFNAVYGDPGRWIYRVVVYGR